MVKVKYIRADGGCLRLPPSRKAASVLHPLLQLLSLLVSPRIKPQKWYYLTVIVTLVGFSGYSNGTRNSSTLLTLESLQSATAYPSLGFTLPANMPSMNRSVGMPYLPSSFEVVDFPPLLRSPLLWGLAHGSVPSVIFLPDELCHHLLHL